MISVVILAKNEEAQIIDCIDSVSWCDEVIVVDDHSTDRTLELIERLHNKKVKVYKHHLENDFSAQRNYGLERASGDWVLFVDADERVSVSLQYEILSQINTIGNHISGYYIKRKDILWSKEMQYGEVGAIALLRLARKEKGQWKGRVHEMWHVKGATTMLANPLLHYPHQSITEFLHEINYYTDLRAQELYLLKKKLPEWQLYVYPVGKFMYNYVWRQGFRDGMPGLILACMMSLHSFMVRGKLWTLWQNAKTS